MYMDERSNGRKSRKIALVAGSALIIILLLGVVVFVFGESAGDKKIAEENVQEPEEDFEARIEIVEEEPADVDIIKMDDPEKEYLDADAGEEGTGEESGADDWADDPQFAGRDDAADGDNVTAGDEPDEPNSAEVRNILKADGASETENVTYGVDVAKYQGTIDWAKVAASGVQFAMVRVGYRTKQDGIIVADTNAKYNMQEASANGIKLGAYFFSTAVNEAEAIEEADWVADYISQYRITYPVAYNCEGFNDSESRQYSLTQTQRTSIARVFLDEIYKRGYTPMFYAAKGELAGNAAWDTGSLDLNYKMWVAYYPTGDYDYSKGPGYDGDYSMWQYSSSGQIDGISKKVDVNIAYFGYASDSEAKSDIAPDTVSADAEALMNFREVNETVTAKNRTNLRDIPGQGEDSTVLVTLENPDTAVRTGISDSGWSRLVYGDRVCYAVSSYLTTDLSAPVQTQQPAQPEEQNNGIKTKFTGCDDWVTAKQEVNLRMLPSVTIEQAQVVYTLHNGETVHRTGYNQEYGWSRVEWNGQVLYCITSYIAVVQ